MASHRIVTLDTLPLQRAAGELYRYVFGYEPTAQALSPRLLMGLLENGGSALGAVGENDELLGFCYGFVGIDDGRTHHYSQAAVVARSAQGLGLGRSLKHAQAEVARRSGVDRMRWAYDPYNVRNAHFNLAVLGATGIRFIPDSYDEPATDRVIVEWEFDRARSLSNDVVQRARAAALSTDAARGTVDGYTWLAADSGSERLSHRYDRSSLAAELSSMLAAGDRLLATERLADDSSAAIYVLGRHEQ